MKNVFQSRNYLLVFLGALVSEMGALLYSFAVSFYILEISGNNAFLQGLYLAVCGAVTLIMTPIGGVLGDRFNKGKIMFVCDYIRGAGIIAATVLMLMFNTHEAHIAILFAIGVLGSAVGGIFSPAGGAILPHILPEDKLQQANSYNSIRQSFQSILGVVLAGVLYALLPVTTLFFIVGACYVASGVSEMFIKYEHVKPATKLTLRTALSDMKDGLKYMKTQKAITALMIAILFINFFFSPVMSNFIPYFIKTDLGTAEKYLFKSFLTPELWMSVLEVLIGISSLVGAAILSAKKQEEKCGGKVARRIGGMALVLIALTAGYWFFVHRGVSMDGFLISLAVGSLVVAFLVVWVNIPINTSIMRIVDKEMLSKVSSIISVASQGLVPIASVLAGAIIQGMGSTALLIFCSIGFICASVFMLLNKKVREI
ncbi:MAG: MFS transporter [Clostridiales bacterium]|nr:MFS transporter [Clostridiales bacterium]